MQNVITFFVIFKQLMSILNCKQKRWAIFIAIMAIFSALLETMGVSVVIPFILAMLQPEQLRDNEYIGQLLELFGVNSAIGIITITAVLIISVYIIKNCFILLFNYLQINFRNKLERDLSNLMLQSYIYRPYQYFLEVNSAEIIRGITGDVSGAATTVDCFCALFNEGLTCILLGILLVVINPFMAISLLLLAVGTTLIMVLGLRKKMAECGEQCREAFSKRYQHAYQAINGIKEIQVMKRQKNFLRYFEEASDVACKYNTRYLWISKLPSRVIETIFISGLVFLVILSMRGINDITVLVAQFGAVAVAAVRILPSISNIANALNSLVYQRPALESVHDNITNLKCSYDSSLQQEILDLPSQAIFRDKIQIKNISWKYSDELPNVLENLDMEIRPGEAIGLIGESGAGKTTLADILLGLFKPQVGEILVDGRSIYENSTNWNKLVGYVPQNVFLIDDTVRNNILFGVDEENVNDERIWKAIEKAQLKEFVEKLPRGLDTVLGERGIKISGGQRQRIAIARALFYNPKIIVLDEATSALDNETENAVMESINNLQGEKTLIIVAHRLTTIEKCDEVYEIRNGKAIKYG
ncbi:ABC transporter ATP-binding protein [Lacrimispora saccharolytica]|uniref:ABC transporter ATP-binding protein n=1 Tax=Lacrimispora saccharolytica TaxID=84030 RepID=UPI00265CAF2B|nr:ABC transporter ATP-binding protein [Lacrimispora saccharolytica]MCF2657070.1 ABC transporter ATP-binding protein [Lacrimispora saccharolytica]